MTRWFLLLLALGLAPLLAGTARRLWREARELRAARAALLDATRPLLDAPRVVMEPSGFPRIAGRVAGDRIDIRAVPDALTFRKLPALWLLATLTEPQPLDGETRILVRPSGFEPFTTFADLPAETNLPPGFPEEAVLRTTSLAHLPPPAVLASLAPLFADRALKEVVLSPRGLRLVRLAEEAPRGAYLLFRDADLGRSAVPATMVGPMLESLRSLARALAEHRPGGHHA